MKPNYSSFVPSRTIKLSVTAIAELLRIVCFLLYYIVLIAIGLVIFVTAGCLSYIFLFKILPDVYHNIFWDIWIVLFIICIWLFAFTLGVYLVRPLFFFRRNENYSRVEVFEQDCPELFAMIRDVANQVRCRMPRHVYLTSEVNACVFYNTSFWSIFFPVRKNLEIGLGLFDGTSIAELKSVIAHEFGHFSQNSMKVGSIVYVTNTVLSNLIITDDSWESWLNNWGMSNIRMVCIFARLTIWITNMIKRLTVYMYMFVQNGYLKLSRQMEYDADSIACRCIGSAVFISALCKTEVQSTMDNFYKQLLQSLVEEKKMIVDYFEGKDLTARIVHSYSKTIPPLAFDKELKEPTCIYVVPPRVWVENKWESHPALDDRIANAIAVNATIALDSASLPSWSLIPDIVLRKVSAIRMSIIRNSVQEELSCISFGEFEEWVSKKVEDTFIDDRLLAFFGETIFEFDLNYKDKDILESPFTEENAIKVAKFVAALNDWQLLEQVRYKKINAREVQIDGRVYKRKNIPFKEFKAELDALHAEVMKIYLAIYSYVCNNCDDSLVESLNDGFLVMFRYNRIVQKSLSRLIECQDALVNELNRPVQRNEEQFKELCSKVKEYKKHIRKVISLLDPDEHVRELKERIDNIYNPSYKINRNSINDMIIITKDISTHAQLVIEKARRHVCKIIAGVLDSNVLTGSET